MELELTEEQYEIMKHTATRAANNAYCGDSPDMQDLVQRGLMRSVGKVAWCPDEYFKLTPLGSTTLQLVNESRKSSPAQKGGKG